MRIALAAINLWLRLKRSDFRVFFHDPRAIDAALGSSGLERRGQQRTVGWEVVVYERVRDSASP